MNILKGDVMNIRSNTPSTSFIKGFTLLEMIVAMTIVAILASLAYPAYHEHVQRGRRAEAKAILMEMAQFMERYYTQYNSYDKATLPVAASPRGGAALYNLNFGGACTRDEKASTTNAAPDCFLIQAIPVVPGSMEKDRCGTFTLDHLGYRAVSGPAGVSECWGK
jgi:type IV pilus assembly protein PilE